MQIRFCLVHYDRSNFVVLSQQRERQSDVGVEGADTGLREIDYTKQQRANREQPWPDEE